MDPCERRRDGGTGLAGAVRCGGFVATLAVAVLGGLLGTRLPIPAGALLLPTAIAIVLRAGGHFDLVLPAGLLAATCMLVGWRIGLGFTREALRHALRAMPAILLSIGALIAFCGALAWLLVAFAGVEPLTAYLAASPGGLDTVAIIGAGSTSTSVS